jgi:hypothetical protein
MSHSIASKIAFWSSLAALIASDQAALAQAGSTGGTIGKTGKSVSGEDASSHARGPARKLSNGEASSQSHGSPQVIRLNEHNTTWGDFSCTLRNVGGNTYEGTWNVPLVSRMTVTLTSGSLTIRRQDAGGLSGLYEGKRSSNGASGSLSLTNGSKGTWDATW